MGKRRKKTGSLVKGLNRRLTLRLVVIFALLDVALLFVAGGWLDGYFAGDELALLMLFVVGIELGVVLVNALQNAGLIKKTLRPLTDLSASATLLSGRVKATQGGLSDLAGRLEGIDAERLDTRLPLEGPAELRELTQTINAMLERLDEAYAAQTRFVSDASHELRTPIAVIQGYASLLNRWGKDDPKARQESIDAILTESESMKQLVEQLLFLARGDNHTLEVKLRSVDATDLAAQVLKETAMVDDRHPLLADWSGEVKVKADPTLAKEALRILMDNACKHTPQGCAITLSVREEGARVRFCVLDEGEGIAPADLPHLFERFYRTDSSRARATGGSGLGLAIARHIAECHNGSLEVQSAPGLGSRFTLALPLDTDSKL